MCMMNIHPLARDADSDQNASELLCVTCCVTSSRDLSENKIVEVSPDVLRGITSITRIDLHTNELERVPSDLFLLPRLTQL